MLAYPGYGESTRQTAGSGDVRSMDADAAFEYLRSRVGDKAAIATAGSSCGVNFALQTVLRHPDSVKAVVALTGPHTPAHLDFVRNTSALAVFSGSAEDERPAPDWARALKEASANAGSRLRIAKGKAHGTDIFAEQPEVAAEIAEWLVGALKASAK
jgi:dienelactone hydrolase